MGFNDSAPGGMHREASDYLWGQLGFMLGGFALKYGVIRR